MIDTEDLFLHFLNFGLKIFQIHFHLLLNFDVRPYCGFSSLSLVFKGLVDLKGYKVLFDKLNEILN